MAKNKHIHKHLRTDSELPPSLDWSNVEEGIYDRMESKGDSKKPVWFPKWLILSGFIILVLAIGYWSYLGSSKLEDFQKTETLHENVNKNKNQNQNQNSKLAAPKIENDKPSKLREIKSETTQYQNASTTKTKTSNEEIRKQKLDKQKVTKQNKVDKQNTSVRQKESVQKSTTSLSSNQSINKDLTKNQKDKVTLANSDLNLNGINTKQNLNEKKIEKLLAPSLLTAITQLEIVKATSINFERENKYLETPELAKSITILNQDLTTSKFGIELGSGLTYWAPMFSGSELSELKSDNENAIISYGTQLMAHYDINSDWRISAGIAYQKFESKFDYYNEKDTLVDSYRIVNTFNHVSGVETTTNEDIQVEAIAWKKVIHYNDYTQVSIPVMISKKWHNFSKLEFDTGLGLSYNLSSRNSGKTIINETENSGAYDIQEFNSSNDSALYTASKVNLLVGGNLRYPLSKSINIGVGIHGSYALSNWSLERQHHFRPMTFQTNILIGYKF